MRVCKLYEATYSLRNIVCNRMRWHRGTVATLHIFTQEQLWRTTQKQKCTNYKRDKQGRSIDNLLETLVSVIRLLDKIYSLIISSSISLELSVNMLQWRYDRLVFIPWKDLMCTYKAEREQAMLVKSKVVCGIAEQIWNRSSKWK